MSQGTSHRRGKTLRRWSGIPEAACRGGTRMITFAIYGIEGFNPALGFGPLQAEFERRGFPCRLVGIPNLKTQTPNRDRAKIMIEALRDVEGELALLGISNHGLFLPLEIGRA